MHVKASVSARMSLVRLVQYSLVLFNRIFFDSTEQTNDDDDDDDDDDDENHASLQQRAPNTYAWYFPDVIKFRFAAHMISEKAIRFQHPDYNRIGLKS